MFPPVGSWPCVPRCPHKQQLSRVLPSVNLAVGVLTVLVVLVGCFGWLVLGFGCFFSLTLGKSLKQKCYVKYC